jgi:hypothetical protein
LPSVVVPTPTLCIEEGSSVKLDERGFIKVDEECRTGVKNVWAIGDLRARPDAGAQGTEEGIMVADLIAGKIAEVNYEVIPSIIYTAPEIAWVGKTEEELKKENVPTRVGKFPFGPNGRAKAMEAAAGFVKMIAHKDSDEILGVHIVGPMAGELIASWSWRWSSAPVRKTSSAPCMRIRRSPEVSTRQPWRRTARLCTVSTAEKSRAHAKTQRGRDMKNGELATRRRLPAHD